MFIWAELMHDDEFIFVIRLVVVGFVGVMKKKNNLY